MIKLRFVHHTDAISDAIDFGTYGLYSHVEALTPDGKYLGAHTDVGVQALPIDYDKGKFDRELLVDLDADDAMTAKFYHYLNAVVGEPYDFGAIAAFITHFDQRMKHHVICSALQTLALSPAPGCGWFPNWLSVPAHRISPRDLLLVLSGRVAIQEK